MAFLFNSEEIANSGQLSFFPNWKLKSVNVVLTKLKNYIQKSLAEFSEPPKRNYDSNRAGLWASMRVLKKVEYISWKNEYAGLDEA